MPLKLHTVNIGGNLHYAAIAINKWGWAEYLIHLDSPSGGNTIAVFRMPADKVHEIRENDPSYIADPHHDDYIGPADPYSATYSGMSTTVQEAVEQIHSPSAGEPGGAPVEGSSTNAATTKPKGRAKAKAATSPETQQEPPAVEQVAGPSPSEQAAAEAGEGIPDYNPGDLPAWAQ